MNANIFFELFLGDLDEKMTSASYRRKRNKKETKKKARRYEVGGAVASWLVRSTPERAVRVGALAGDIVLCSCSRHFTLTVPLSTQVYKWVPANLMLGGNPAMD